MTCVYLEVTREDHMFGHSFCVPACYVDQWTINDVNQMVDSEIGNVADYDVEYDPERREIRFSARVSGKQTFGWATCIMQRFRRSLEPLLEQFDAVIFRLPANN